MDMDDQQGLNQLISRNRDKGLVNDHEDFNEEDVWAVNLMKSRDGGSNCKAKRSLEYYRIPTVPKVISRANGADHHHLLHQPVITHSQSSAPTRIPTFYDNSTEWSSSASNGNGYYTVKNDADDDEDSDEMLPPHEFIARRLARNPVVSCSMCEGVGRTLKGRDLSKLRNAILTKTGFLE